MHVLARCSIIILYFLLFTFLKRLEEESKKSNVRDVSCVAILSGRRTGVGGQSIAYVRKKQYLCIVFRNDLNTRKRDVRSANEMRTKMNRNNQDYESRIDNSYRKFTRCVEEGWLLLPDMQRTADCAKVSSEMDRYASTQGCTGKVHR